MFAFLDPFLIHGILVGKDMEHIGGGSFTRQWLCFRDSSRRQ